MTDIKPNEAALKCRFGCFRSAQRLPGGYLYAGVMDFVRNIKLLRIVGFSGLIAAALMIIGGILFIPFSPTWNLLKARWYLALAIPIIHLAYICLHELTHGIFMHAISGIKPRYGFKLCYAYAGSDVWFDRKSHILIALAPVVIWGIILQILCHTLPEGWFWIIWTVQISNISGAAGDIYCAIHLARFPGDILIQDTGTRMRIMRKSNLKKQTEESRQ